NGDTSDYGNMGVQGAMFQMIAHGISSSGMFFMVGVLYDRVHHRNLNEFGGIFGKMPYYTAMAILIFFAGLGLPGLCGFIGEVFVVLSVWKFSYILAILSAAVVILTAGYILWAVQRVYLGPEYKGPHGDHLTPSDFRENLIGTTLCIFAILFGVFPYQFPGGQPSVLKYMDATIDQQVADLADWTREEETNKRAATALRVPPGLSRPVHATLPRVPSALLRRAVGIPGCGPIAGSSEQSGNRDADGNFYGDAGLRHVLGLCPLAAAGVRGAAGNFHQDHRHSRPRRRPGRVHAVSRRDDR